MSITAQTRKTKVRVDVEVVAPDFSLQQPFSFLCNARINDPIWTPKRLADELQIFNFGNLSYTSCIVTTQNFDESLEAIEAWMERGYRIHLKFPSLKIRPVVGNDEDPTFMGLSVMECYECYRKTWRATHEFKTLISSLFIDDRLVRVET